MTIRFQPVHLFQGIYGKRVYFACGCSHSMPVNDASIHTDEASLVTCRRCLCTVLYHRRVFDFNGGAA